MRKNYILDTKILLHDPSSLTHFDGNDIHIPIEVTQEIDQFKKEMTNRGQNARVVTRHLDALRGSQSGSLTHAVPLPGGSAADLHTWP